jgi:hypothetical protein
MNLLRMIPVLKTYRKSVLPFFLLAAGLTTITACSGGSSTTSAPTPLTGVFLDAPVQGLNYRTGTMNGITDANGTFRYQEGEEITFMIGDVMLGSAPGSHLMTPLDLVPGAVDESDPTVTNICRLLQSLDWDGDLADGIMLTEAMRSEISGRMIDFTKDPAAFNDYDIQAFFDTMNTLGGFQNGERRDLMTPQEAQDHFHQTLTGHIDYMHAINPAWDPIPSGTGMGGMSPGNPDSSPLAQGGGMLQ